jgi:uncharacterized repeat protein (TIGR03803 family)
VKTKFKSLFALCVIILPLPAHLQAGVVFTSLYSFTGTNDGANPYATLVQNNNGYFYGTTVNGGTNNYGTVFKISAVGELTSLYSFTSTNDGAYPFGGLVQGSDGYLYGTTSGGGTNGGYGTVFKISTSGVLTSLCSFGYEGTPLAGLVQGSDGNFYGTTALGGLYNSGTVFKFSTNGALTNLYSFTGHYDGGIPYAGLVQCNDDKFYGTTSYGYQGYYTGLFPGTVFQIDTNGVLTTLYRFTGPGDGEYPRAALVQDGDGNLYGTTEGDPSINIRGSVFQIRTNGLLTSLPSFTGTNDGANPYAGLVLGSNGSLYGTTSGGGNSGIGTVFAVNTNGTGFTTLYSFSASSTNSSGVYTNSDGANPKAGLILSGNTLYGTTSAGGSSGYGTVFSLLIPPQLIITLSGTNVLLSWPTNAADYTLEFATNLVSPVAWNANLTVLTGQAVIGSQNVVTNPISGSQMFFRLQGTSDCVVSGTQPTFPAFETGLQALAEAYGLAYTFQTTGPGQGTGVRKVMTLDTNGCVIAYCNANTQWGCTLTTVNDNCVPLGALMLAAGTPVVSWGPLMSCSDNHIWTW